MTTRILLAAAMSVALSASTVRASSPVAADSSPELASLIAEDAGAQALATFQADHQRAAEERYHLLRESAQPRDWAVASQMWLATQSADDGGQAERAQALRNAAAAAPGDALVQWMALNLMPHTGGCANADAPSEYLPAVMREESDNALAWLPVLKQAWNSKDALAIDSALAHMAASPRVEDHVGEYARLLHDISQRYPQAPLGVPPGTPQDQRAAVLYFVLAESLNLNPSLQVLTEVCDRAEQSDADLRRFSVCADIGRAISRKSMSLGVRRQALAVLRVAQQFDSGDEALERELNWLDSQSFEEIGGSEEAIFDAYFSTWLRDGDEIGALRQVLKARGIATSPPADWIADPVGPETEPDKVEID